MGKIYNNDDNKTNTKDTLYTFAIITVFGLILMGLINLGELNKNKQIAADTARINEIEMKEIQSCVLNTETNLKASGAFVLGTGGFSGGSDTEFKYYLYIYGREGFSLQEIEARYVEIVPTDTEIPHIKGHFTEYGEVYDYTKAVRERKGTDKSFCEEMMRYTVYVPTNYITQEYSTSIASALQ